MNSTLRLFIPLLLLSGCTLKNHKKDITEYIIIGFGKVTQQEYPEARSTRAKGFGILYKSEPAPSFNIGYSDSQTVSVKPGTHINIQLQDHLGLPLINTKALQQPSQEQNHEDMSCHNH